MKTMTIVGIEASDFSSIEFGCGPFFVDMRHVELEVVVSDDSGSETIYVNVERDNTIESIRAFGVASEPAMRKIKAVESNDDVIPWEDLCDIEAFDFILDAIEDDDDIVEENVPAALEASSFFELYKYADSVIDRMTHAFPTK